MHVQNLPKLTHVGRPFNIVVIADFLLRLKAMPSIKMLNCFERRYGTWAILTATSKLFAIAIVMPRSEETIANHYSKNFITGPVEGSKVNSERLRSETAEGSLRFSSQLQPHVNCDLLQP